MEQMPVDVLQAKALFSEDGASDTHIRSPGEKGIRLVSRGDGDPVWGIVCRQAEYFMMDGFPTGFLVAGKRIGYRGTRYSAHGAMIEFTVDGAAGLPSTPFLISQTNVLLFAGACDGLSAQQISELWTNYTQDQAPSPAEDKQTWAPPRGIQLVLRGDLVPMWGVVRKQTSRYRADGGWLGFVDAGALIDYRRTVSSSKGPMAECLLGVTNGVLPARTLISLEALHLFTGSYTSLSKEQIRDLQTYYEVAGKIESRKNEMLQASAAKNPFFPAYQSSYQALAAHIERAKEEVVRRDHAAGAEKVQAQERLFKMRMEERRLDIAFQEAEKKVKEWKKEHAGEWQSPDKDLDIKRWEKLRHTLAPSIPGLAF